MSVNRYKYTIEELKKIAEEIAKQASPPFSVLLYGDLGSGKTTFSQFFIRHLIDNKNETITSPTFNIVQIYESSKIGPIWHADLYRLKHPDEVQELGLLEAMYKNVCIIEWPEFLEPYLDKNNFIKVIL